ncbi:hypothetical protein SPRG_09247 [Saprolegnia parasitica CBS 223.65]|uniref:Uncharacterized protein n=1 Tax=Saprolegnia parasitica (strain CBS 223.65) TaxID=695850 RepID=A0A067C7G1_SAPPC|nr:hypothetical protein SPRG_09247 [Saprolegnia parasitica CBS 223.65]KDO25105.1 hypothetical protein SPRG_09247 [Saprolegnia parasitica CBS 223.65]|eukprot:XP_012204178.1 hypothetical protein SPRG_09247 [Saprolegnia parasitica CBS 223.65]
MPAIKLHRPRIVAGLVYLAVSLSFGVWYLWLLAPSLANDLWWAGFTPTGCEALLIDVINARLATAGTGALHLYGANATSPKTYNLTRATTNVLPTYARTILFSELTSIEYAVRQLRTLSASWSMRMNVQHCWIDFGQSFEVALTEARQQRCRERYASNAAVYMEAILRNVVWADYMTIWGGENGPFTVAVQLALEESSHGRAFLKAVSIARDTTTCDDELKYWQTFGLVSFQLQWHNRWQSSIHETIVLENAIGMQQVLSLKNLPQQAGPWTSSALFWLPLNSLWSPQFVNRSLVRGSSRFFGANASADMPAIDIEVLEGVTSVSGQFENQLEIFRRVIGPFQSVDCLFIQAPSTLQALVGTLHASQPRLGTLPPASLALTPLAWRNYASYYGGNLMCTALPSTSYPQQPFDFFDDCTRPEPLTITFDPVALLLARAATTNMSIRDVCRAASPASVCEAALDAVTPLHIPLDALASTVSSTMTTDVGLMQYAIAANGSWVVLRQPLLEPSFSLFGWLFLVDWALGRREVISFQGDVGALTLISNLYTPQLYTTGTQPLQTATQILYYLVVATSVILVGVGGLTVVYAIKTRCRFNGVNLFFFNRIVSAVWLGRPLAFLRGASAMLLLSSANLSLATSSDGVSRFVASPRSWLATAVVTGEATWLTYMVSDILVLVTRQSTAPCSTFGSLVSWLLMFLLEVSDPVQVTGTLQRECVGVDMDYGVACTSGVVSVGSLTRMAAIGGIQAAGIVVSLSWSLLRAAREVNHRATIEAPLLLSSVSHVFLRTESSSTRVSVDHVSCVLAGLLPLRFGGKPYIFDVKLWRLVRDELSTTSHLAVLPRPVFATSTKHKNGPALASHHVPSIASSRWVHAVRMLGLCYVASSIVGSISYLTVSRVNLANDVFWATFNTTGAHAFFANWLNEQLVLGNTTMLSLALDRPSINLMASFASPSAVVTSPANYGAYLQHTLLHTIEATIQGLRRSSGCDAPWIFSPYCYVDMARRWEMANTAKRQARCSSMTSNGAAFLETVLRNIDFDAFLACWSTAFDITIASELRLSAAGAAWLATTTGTQWQNYKRLGVRNQYSITNAYGVVYSLGLSSQLSTYRFGSQSTFKMYWALANDLSAVISNASCIAGSSLLRSSAKHAFANTTLSAVYMANGTLPSPLPEGYELTASVLGPFGSIDMVYISPPPSLQQLLSSFVELLRAPLVGNVAAQAAFHSIVPLDASYPVPSAWLTSSFYVFGSSPLCPGLTSGQSVANGLNNILVYDTTCIAAAGLSARLQPTRQQYIVGAILSNVQYEHHDRVCRLDPSFVPACLVYLKASHTYIHDYMQLPHTLSNDVAAVNDHIRFLNISFMTFAGDRSTATTLTLRTINLLDRSEANFEFFAWLFLYDWVVGLREVVSFQGDIGTLTLITGMEVPLSKPAPAWEVPANIARYFRAGVMYVTGVMMAVASLTALYIVAGRSRFEGWNMLELGRVGGIVWVGRPFLLLRSMTALCVLSTATLELQYSGYISSFVFVRDPWYKTLLAANEVTWLITIVNDILLVVTGDYAAYYVTLNGFLVYLITAALTLLEPVTPRTSIHLKCYLEQIDAMAVCDAGTIEIGRLDRLLLLVVSVVISHGVCYIMVKLCVRPAPTSAVASLFLTSGAKYQFCTSSWVVQNNVYHLDRASAALVGLLTLQLRSAMITLDIKTWRAYALPMNTSVDLPDALQAAVPLVD